MKRNISPEEKKKMAAAPAHGYSRKTVRRLIVLLWLFLLSPVWGVALMLWLSSSDLPSIKELENPESSLASEIYTSDGEMIGKYFRENRSSVSYSELSPYLVDCLVATEDERFYNHCGVDFEAVGRVVKGVLTGSTSQGGGSTISQQLAKLLFPREDLGTWGLVKRKFKEWIIAARLERTFTKEEIITLYFNKFDFNNNAVGIKSASRVYFNTTPDSLTLEQAAMLVGMLQNPSLHNPKSHPERAKKRREVVLKQLLINNSNPRIRTKLTRREYDRVRQLPLELDFQRVDHAEGIAPYYRESLRKELQKLFNTKDEDGNYVYRKKDGSKFDIYTDGLKIYSTLDARMQRYAEWAVQEHLKKELQKDFDKELKRAKHFPFAWDVTEEKREQIMQSSRKRSDRYLVYTGKRCGNCDRGSDVISVSKSNGRPVYSCSHCKHITQGKSEAEIAKMFDQKFPMKIFSWSGKDYETDTVMTPNDSIRYYMKMLRAALISVEPQTGFVKAWVGGPYFKHFKNDQVVGRRQVGSTFKPFVYSAAFRAGIFSPCSEIPDIEHCIENPVSKYTTKMWCPGNSGARFSGEMMPLYFALPASMNNITAAIIKQEKPATVIRMLETMGIEKGYLPPVPSICLGACELSPYEMIGAQSSFANKGIYIKPILFTRIEDKNGNVIFDVEPETSEAMDENTAYTMLQVMKGTTSGVPHPTAKSARGGPLYGGTATRIRSSSKAYGGLKPPIAGKTGTTQNNTDGWFIGITPDLATAVWVGADNSGVHFPNGRTDLGQGANTGLPIFGYYMKKVYADKRLKISQKDFEAPKDYHMFDCLDYRIENTDLMKRIDNGELEERNFGTDTTGKHKEEPDPYDGL